MSLSGKIIFSFFLLLQILVTVISTIIYLIEGELHFLMNLYAGGISFILSIILLILMNFFYYPKTMLPIILVAFLISLVVFFPFLIKDFSWETRKNTSLILSLICILQLILWFRFLFIKRENHS
ncbi:hypothetical protein SAMN06296427_104179 [Moheibacter sediminis]|uniref:Uncharacterized protein n=1 Tax=Moheibacter sediminis TaxID=1434700 RepID=A0A1W2AHN0_9FLAO|nr:hypothetical protein SAMN06296427_104179 [Moheibacter sediminis]